jgi:valyl-tRNA synthetase
MEELPKAYVAAEYEPHIYDLWEKSGAFAPDMNSQKPPFSLVMPPPNANGNLHMGHALEVAIIDILTRFHRMKGYNTLTVPGADHAGLETQVVFEKKLEKEGRSRFQMTREQFYNEVREFTLENKKNMEDQLRMLGVSADWSAERFTLDPAVVERVYATFRKMYSEGLIYRGERIVNYSIKYQTAYSDIEVLHEDRQDPLYYIKYGPITIATVRPETKFGEKYIVVHPEDERYKQYVGTTFKAKIATGEELDMQVIADDAIKPDFGTGAMTITPAHDPVDYEIAKRHNLPIVPIIGFDGRLLPIAGEFAGMKVAEARKAVAAKLEELGLMEKIDHTYRHSVALCYKSLQPIEPMIMPQWYVKVEPLAKRAIEAIEKGEIEYLPEGFKKVQLDWLRNLKDWNISRQIWWGIPISGAMPEVPEVANDTDTFDTWFSSGQWPYTVLEAISEDAVKTFYPTTVMQTGRDLIFQWVTRMLMLGLYIQGEVPFKQVYFHGMVLDKDGKKMSKSKGNVTSPVDMVAKYGADAVRFGLMIGSAAGSDIPMPEEKMIGGRNFANKLWNISRFVQMSLNGREAKDLPEIVMNGDKENARMSVTSNNPDHAIALTQADKELTHDYLGTVAEVTTHIENYRFGQALQQIHEFTWHQFADVYIEAAKNQKDDSGQVDARTAAILLYTLQTILKLSHPFMPFVTETIWQQLMPGTLLMTETWPEIVQHEAK